VRIEFFGDFLCPWCFIGKRRLTSSLLLVGGSVDVQIIWRGFELDPNHQKTPGPTAEDLIREWRGDAADDHIRLIKRSGLAEGLELNLHLARPVNTFDAHRLVQLAADHGLADEITEELFHAYHTQGRNLADPKVLEQLGIKAGLRSDEIRESLSSDLYGREVKEDRKRALAIPGTLAAAELQNVLKDFLGDGKEMR
jgi:predicted DsbA family dithiol-disulfide isomerase